VLFVVGAARSGTTLVDLLLGRVPGLAVVGELRYLWQRGLLEGRLCGCGRPVPECSFWRDVLTDARMDPASDPRGMVGALVALERPNAIVDMFRHHAHPDRSDQALADQVGAVLQSIAGRSGARVVVDSSKPPTYGRLLRMTPAVDLHVVHMVRDPRACAFSQQRVRSSRDRADGALMRRQPAWKAAATWDLWNLAADRLREPAPDKYLRVHYEDLVAEPEPWLRRIVRLVGLDEATVPATLPDHDLALDVQHTVAGNPVRLARSVAVRPDREWTRCMRSGPRRVVEAISRPVMAHYGY
jgi:hypothetical protein